MIDEQPTHDRTIPNKWPDKPMTTQDDYEEGVYYVPVRKHWYQFWLPKFVEAGTYTTIGNVTQVRVFGVGFNFIGNAVK